jgi:hypothetical protein
MFLSKYRANSFIRGIYFDNAFFSGVKELSFGSFFRNLFKLVECLLLFVSLDKRYIFLSKLGKSY